MVSLQIDYIGTQEKSVLLIKFSYIPAFRTSQELEYDLSEYGLSLESHENYNLTGNYTDLNHNYHANNWYYYWSI